MSVLDLIASDRRAVFLDGAMGTQLGEAGLEMGGQTNVSHPEAVLAVHRQYAACGIDLLITNTLTMNRVNIESHKVGVDVREVNLAGARLAREAARDGQYVLGDMSSTGKMLKPYGPLAEDDAYRHLQGAGGHSGGRRGGRVHHRDDVRSAGGPLRRARRTKRRATLPVIATIAFNTAGNGGRTVMGNTAHECAQALTEAGACAVGANCGSLDPLEVAEVVSLMRAATSLPLIVQPNAGKGRLVEKRLVFDMPPARFAAGVEGMRAGGSSAGRRMLRHFACPHQGDGGAGWWSPVLRRTRPGRDHGPQDVTDPQASSCPVDTRGRTDTLAASLMLLLALTGMALSLIPVVADQLRADFGYSDSQIGLLTSVFMLALGAVAIPWGLAGARWGGRTLAFGLAIGTAGSLLLAFADSYGGFLAGRLVQGVGLGVIVPVVGTVIPDAVSPRFRGRAWGFFGTGHGLGVVMALLILPSIAGAAGYREPRSSLPRS